MNGEVFLSILAMDWYQRGYAPGIDKVTGNKIGTAIIRAASSIDVNSPEYRVGFFAQSYQWGSDTVISYRGTDFDLANEFRPSDGIFAKGRKVLDSQFIKDLTNGWSTFWAAGLTLPAQFPMARTFFTSVTGGDFNDGVQLQLR